MWPGRLVYTAMRDANELERLMSVCPPWGSAREYNPSFNLSFLAFQTAPPPSTTLFSFIWWIDVILIPSFNPVVRINAT